MGCQGHLLIRVFRSLADVSDFFFSLFFLFERGQGGGVQGEKGRVLFFGNREGGVGSEERRWGWAHRGLGGCLPGGRGGGQKFIFGVEIPPRKGRDLSAQIARCNRDVRCDSNRTPPNR